MAPAWAAAAPAPATAWVARPCGAPAQRPSRPWPARWAAAPVRRWAAASGREAEAAAVTGAGIQGGASGGGLAEPGRRPPRRPPGIGRIGGRTSVSRGRTAPGTRAPPRSASAPQGGEEEDTNVLGKVLTLLVALWLGRFALESMLFPSSYQDTYYYSSRSMIAVTSVDENGERKTSVKEDSSVRTNIPGLQSRERSDGDSRPTLLLPSGFFEPYP
mmetsp:Transcript_104081/g.315910  ORF Transcript_104081/g.315910 Transcript_104081/m.315910 type:complete len:216 (-) Transcript_104081:61-708(-)